MSADEPNSIDVGSEAFRAAFTQMLDHGAEQRRRDRKAQADAKRLKSIITFVAIAYLATHDRLNLDGFDLTTFLVNLTNR